MADIPPPNPSSGPTGPVQPPKKETGKVQPKKETVRINLPPRPTAAPTIKLPTLPPSGPTGAPSAVPIGTAPAPALAARPQASAPAPAPAATRPGAPGAPATAQRPAPVAQRPVAPALAPAIKPLDKILIYCAAFFGLVGAGFAGFVFYKLNDIVTTFTS